MLGGCCDACGDTGRNKPDEVLCVTCKPGKEATLNYNKTAMELVITFTDGNRSDLVDGLRDLHPLDAALVALHMAAHFPKQVNDIIKAIEARR